MKPSLRLKLDQLAARLAEVEHLLAAPETVRDMERFRALSKEHAEIGPVAQMLASYRKAEDDLATAGTMAADPELAAFAEEERKRKAESFARAIGGAK